MRRSLLPLVSLCSLSACAWTARENRPVWNAFEATCVPESDGAFYAALPLTVPVGFCAILADTFVAHPIQVVDDSFDDAADIWRDVDYEHAYYTQSGLLPLRAAATPVWFALSFLGRSCFDLPSEEEEVVRTERRAARERRELLAALAAIARGADGTTLVMPRVLDAEVKAAVHAALASANALGRLRIYGVFARGADDTIDWNAAFGDPSAVVRHQLLRELPVHVPLSDATKDRLCADPDEAVRLRAQARFPR